MSETNSSLQENLPESNSLHLSEKNGVNSQTTEASRQVELFVRAGKNGESYGGCPICQRFFMILLTKAEYNKDLALVVTTVNMSKPPADFKKLATRLPVLGCEDEIISDPDEIVQYIDKKFRYPPMNYDNVAAANACRDVFSKFSFFIKEVLHSPAPLIAELNKLNFYIENSGFRFLCRDIPDHLDCIMLPKLQHIRVAAKALKGFEIPIEMKGLWRYLATSYNTPAFRDSCPSDQEIVYHWESKPECSSLTKEQQAIYSIDGPPVYSFDYPEGVYEIQ